MFSLLLMFAVVSNELKELLASTSRLYLIVGLRDSYSILPASLSKLAKIGQILTILKDQVLSYMKQDITLLAGVMLKAQEIYCTEYKVEIEDCMTLAALAMIV